LKYFHWYGEPYFLGTAILVDGFLPQIPKSLQTQWVLSGESV
jgi:hypothetical protein